MSLVLILQISVGGRTLEDYLMSFIHSSDSLAPVRDIAYSSVRRINPNVQIKEAEKRAPASIPPSGQKSVELNKTDMFGDILNMVLSQYKNILAGVLQSTQKVENHPVNIEKELKKITEPEKEEKPPSTSQEEKPST